MSEAAKKYENAARELLLRPNPADPRLTEKVAGVDHEGNRVDTSVVVERPLTLFLNSPPPLRRL